MVMVAVADDASLKQADSDLVPSLQLHSCDCRVAVFIVLTSSFKESSHHFAINEEVGAGDLGAAGQTRAVDCDGEAVDTRAWDGEDASLHVVAISQVDKDMFVDDDSVISEAIIAAQA